MELCSSTCIFNVLQMPVVHILLAHLVFQHDFYMPEKERKDKDKRIKKIFIDSIIFNTKGF